MILALYFYFLLGPQGTEFRTRLRYFVVVIVVLGGDRGLMRMRHGMSEIEMNDDWFHAVPSQLLGSFGRHGRRRGYLCLED